MILLSQVPGNLRSVVEKFSRFRGTASKFIPEKMREQALTRARETGQSPRLEQTEKADYTLLARIDSIYTHGDGAVSAGGTLSRVGMMAIGILQHSEEMATVGEMTTGVAQNMEPTVVEVSMTFKLYDNAKGRLIHTEHIDKESKGVAKHNTGAVILATVRQCLKEYGRLLAREYMQETRVLETRGAGAYAWVSMGRNEGGRREAM